LIMLLLSVWFPFTLWWQLRKDPIDSAPGLIAGVTGAVAVYAFLAGYCGLMMKTVAWGTSEIDLLPLSDLAFLAAYSVIGLFIPFFGICRKLDSR